MTRRLLGLLVLSFPLETTLIHGHIVQHRGAADPLVEGFTGNVSGNAQVGPVVGDQGRDAWSLDLNGGSDIAIYQHFLSAQEQSAATTVGWEISLDLRLVDGHTGARFYTGSSLFSLRFNVEPDGDLVVEAGPGVSGPGIFYSVEGGGGSYHQYRLIYDAGSTTADLWVDGIERIGDLAGITLPTQSRFDWGTGQNSVSAHWSEATLSVVPEPGAVVLLALGCSILGVQSLRRCVKGPVNRRRDA